MLPTAPESLTGESHAVYLAYTQVWMFYCMQGACMDTNCLRSVQDAADDMMPSNLQQVDARAARQLTSEITRAGAEVYNALKQEAELADARARQVLDA